MEEINMIFKKLDHKKELIIKYEEELQKINQLKNKYSTKDFNNLLKSLYKEFKKELKLIDKSFKI